ncbi:MAG TPA: tetratricopeptide repeat protein [Solirubrobacteraceae bacterium]|nr:tetratricopeptide repeat protein [Solirubrobacteraceae bacterium]
MIRRAAIAAALAFGLTFAVLLLSGTADGPEPTAAGAPSGGSTAARIARLTATVRERPRDAGAHVSLADAYLQRARDLEDPRDYDRAEAAAERALELKPGDAGALTERALVRAGKHDFRAALADARAARAAAPGVNKPFGVLVDALVELGRYRAAERALQRMIDRKPNLDGYARASYLRELRGDLRGAERALRLAISAGGDASASTAYVRALAGDLQLVRGRPAAALREYRAALRIVPGHPKSTHGTGRAQAALGRYAATVRTLRALVERVPAADHFVDLAHAERRIGRRAAARRHLREALRLARTSGTLEGGVVVVEADLGDPERAVLLGRRLWRAAPSVGSAHALGWALTRAGQPRAGLRWARRALRLGSRDPSFLFHAAVAASRSGRPGLERRLLRRAPSLSPWDCDRPQPSDVEDC